MRRVVLELLKHKGIHYRSSSDDGLTQIGGLPAEQITPSRKSTARAYTDEQVEVALDLMSYNSLSELGRQDFSVFGKKQSWVQLANGCVQRLATDLLLLTDIREAIERCDLLYNRLETRREAKVRTPNETQNSIHTLNLLRVCLRDLYNLSTGRKVGALERAVGKAQMVMNTWRSVSSLVPAASPRTDALIEMVKLGMENVVQDGSASDSVKAVARRVVVQFSVSGVKVPGEQVSWDSD
jgi:hypothetical protein